MLGTCGVPHIRGPLALTNELRTEKPVLPGGRSLHPTPGKGPSAQYHPPWGEPEWVYDGLINVLTPYIVDVFILSDEQEY